MSYKAILLKSIPIITFTTVLFPTTNVAKAASPEIQIAAAPKSDSHSAKGVSENKVTEIILSKKAQKIEFMIFLSLISLGVFAPEFFYNPQKNSEQSLDTEDDQDKTKAEVKVIKSEIDFLKAISEQTKDVDLFFDNKVLSNSTNGKVETQKTEKSA